MSEPQRRNAGAFIEDTWRKKDGTPKARNGIGHRWRVHVTDLDGNRTGRYFARKIEAEAYRDEVRAQLLRGAFVPESAGGITVEEMYEQWLTQTAHTADSTRSTREITWETWVAPKWRRTLVRDVRRSAVRAWVSEMQSDGAGPATIENAVGVLRMVLGLAVEDRRITENPASKVKTPPRDHRPRAYLTHQQVWRLSDAIDARYSTLVLFLAYTGMRFGEVAALEVRDLDLLRRMVEVRQQVTEVEGRLSWTPTKGKRRRTIPVPRFLVEPLAALCEGKSLDGQVFTAPRGGVLRLNTWRDRQWNPVIELLKGTDGFPDATPHDLRHTAASLAISAGANVLAVQRMLGHKSAAMTLDRYSDLFTDDLEAVAAAFDTSVEALSVSRALPPA